jgi:hypothetical protein
MIKSIFLSTFEEYKHSAMSEFVVPYYKKITSLYYESVPSESRRLLMKRIKDIESKFKIEKKKVKGIFNQMFLFF